MATAIKSAEKILEGLSEAQRAAASYLDGSLIIIAGPGSGKTRVMSHRMAYILATGVAPWRALGVTFTNKAASELRQRCQALVSEFIPDLSDANVSTFHSFGAKFLRVHSDAVGLKREFTIYDRDDQTRLLKLILDQMDADAKVNDVLRDISAAKNNNQSPEDLASVSASHKKELHAEIYSHYEAGMSSANAVDFDDLLLKPYRTLVQDSAIRQLYQERYLHIMVDEFQDTNSLQFELVRLLGDKHRKICVVGDPDQSIYSWRSARPENMGLLADVMRDCKIVHLSESYRSTKMIINAADGLIANNPGRFKRTLFTKNAVGERVEIGFVKDPEHEASVVVDTIEAARLDGSVAKGALALDDFAILYRTNAQSRAVETECSKRGLPYRLIGGVRFYERREIKDAMALLRIVVNPTDETSLRRIINVPPRGIGPVTLRKLEEHSHFSEVSLLASVMTSIDPVASSSLGLGNSALKKVAAFADFINTIIINSEVQYPKDLLEYALKASGYLEWLQRDESTRVERTENLRELTLLAETYSVSEAVEPMQALTDFLEHTALFSNVDSIAPGVAADGAPRKPSVESTTGAVTLITLHQAKGLEFDTVFIVGVCEGMLPHSLALDVNTQEAYEAACGEERRLMYVGMTRAKRKLHITSPKSRGANPYLGTLNTPSRFLNEIPDECVKHVDHTAAKQFQAPAPVAFSAAYRRLDHRPIRSASRRKLTEEGLERIPEEWRFNDGERVNHHQFGDGVVVNARVTGDDLRLTVAFKTAGVKTLLGSMAQLKRI